MADADRNVIRIATRTSPLALWQANHVRDRILEFVEGVSVELVDVSTIGDRDRATALASMGGQGVFTKEVQNAVLSGRADLAVHSLKDLPTDTTDGLTLAGVPERAPVADALVLPADVSIGLPGRLESMPFDVLTAGARIGTGSPRRQAQLLHARPDLQMFENRGNVETRLQKLDDGEFDAIILAEAGLTRLGYGSRISTRLVPPLMLHAVGQGALGIECRHDDQFIVDLLSQISDANVIAAVSAERSLLRDLRAGCHAPVGTTTSFADDGRLTLRGVVLSLDGEERLEASASSSPENAEGLGVEVSALLRADGAERLLTPASS
ncbi:MAG: hydroxymethylbilane synthase [Planctomycetota bacterium]|nr:hydroxymethylbilane synthase [Planctomycetota bacterium]